MDFDRDYFEDFLKKIMAYDSPSGYTKSLIEKLKEEAESIGFKAIITKKGMLIVHIDGNNPEKTVAIGAHADTLGLMVKSITDKGYLKITLVGSPTVATLDGEYCKIITRFGKTYTGTILSKSPSSHVYKDATSIERTVENMLVRIDEKVKDKKEVVELGISAGDYIAIDTKTEITENGFIKSRFLDDKISVAILFLMLKQMKKSNFKPKYNTKVMITNYEEVGHGMSYLGIDIDELLAVDMGCIGDDLNCTEYDVSICAKDASGPYDYELTTKLINYAKTKNLNHAVDVYPYYVSDVSAARTSGNDLKGALIGPGVHASHGMERSHIDAVKNTFELIKEYLING